MVKCCFPKDWVLFISMNLSVPLALIAMPEKLPASAPKLVITFTFCTRLFNLIGSVLLSPLSFLKAKACFSRVNSVTLLTR